LRTIWFLSTLQTEKLAAVNTNDGTYNFKSFFVGVFRGPPSKKPVRKVVPNQSLQ